MTEVNLPRELLHFYEELGVLLNRLQGKIFLHGLEITEQVLQEHFSKGVPLFTLVPSEIEPSLCREIFKEICSLLAEKRPQTSQQVMALEGIGNQAVERLVYDYIRGEEQDIELLVKDNGLSRMTVDFVLECTAKPFMRAYAQLLGPSTRNEEWQKNYCPVCGNKARYAKIADKDNKRYLQCTLCDHQWLYKRLACPNCSNEDHNSLKTLLIEETPYYQIHVCEQCKTYLKVFDSRQGSSENPALKDAKTIFLDIIAQQKGYINGYFAS